MCLIVLVDTYVFMFAGLCKNLREIFRAGTSSTYKHTSHKSQLILAQRLPTVCINAWAALEVQATRLLGMSGLSATTTTKPQKEKEKRDGKKGRIDKIGESASSVKTTDVKASLWILTAWKPRLLTAPNYTKLRPRRAEIHSFMFPFVKMCWCLGLCVVQPNRTSKSK